MLEAGSYVFFLTDGSNNHFGVLLKFCKRKKIMTIQRLPDKKILKIPQSKVADASFYDANFNEMITRLQATAKGRKERKAILEIIFPWTKFTFVQFKKGDPKPVPPMQIDISAKEDEPVSPMQADNSTKEDAPVKPMQVDNSIKEAGEEKNWTWLQKPREFHLYKEKTRIHHLILGNIKDKGGHRGTGTRGHAGKTDRIRNKGRFTRFPDKDVRLNKKRRREETIAKHKIYAEGAKLLTDLRTPYKQAKK